MNHFRLNLLLLAFLCVLQLGADCGGTGTLSGNLRGRFVDSNNHAPINPRNIPGGLRFLPQPPVLPAETCRQLDAREARSGNVVDDGDGFVVTTISGTLSSGKFDGVVFGPCDFRTEPHGTVSVRPKRVQFEVEGGTFSGALGDIEVEIQ